ncbi:MAG: hypothetical protein R3B72_07610 [Polyangiaceae bacterium]
MSPLGKWVILTLVLGAGCGSRIEQRGSAGGPDGAEGGAGGVSSGEMDTSRPKALAQGWYDYCNCLPEASLRTECIARSGIFDCWHDFTLLEVQLLAFPDCGCDWDCVTAAVEQAPPNPAREAYREACYAACDGSLDPTLCEAYMLDASYLAATACLDASPCYEASSCFTLCFDEEIPPP